MQTAITNLFGCEVPIVQAPMAGGADTPQLVAAVGNAGAIGFIGAAYLSPTQIADACRAVRVLSTRPFGINLFAPIPVPRATDLGAAVARLARFHDELGLPPPSATAPALDSFDAQLDAALECGVQAFSFTFGLIPAMALARLKAHRVAVAGTATTVAEAVALHKSGVDAVIAQGAEAGGHRGTFLGDFAASQIGTIALVPQVVDAIDVPVVASGGIMDGRGIAAALALGAAGVQLGTAFLPCNESGVPEVYKRALLAAHEDSTRVTRAFSGRPARGIVNRFMREIDTDDAAIPDFPLQNALTRPLRSAAAKQGRAEFLSLWAGQGARLARRLPAAQLVAALVRETQAARTG